MHWQCNLQSQYRADLSDDYSEKSNFTLPDSDDKENKTQGAPESKKKSVTIDARASNVYMFYD